MVKRRVTSRYYPGLVSRLRTVNTQIEEFEAVVYRNDLELRLANDTGTNLRQIKEEVNVNNPRITEKLDVLYKVRSELEKELQAGEG